MSLITLAICDNIKNFFRHNSSQYQTYFLMVLTHYADSGVITSKKKFYDIGHRARAAGLEKAAMSIMTGQGKDLIKGHSCCPFNPL
jgi:hypothetical protein